jgi:hypothetical protein
MPTIEIDEHTFRSLEFAAHMARTTPSDLVARLVAEKSTGVSAPSEKTEQPENAQRVAVFAVYEGRRTQGKYDRTTSRIDITSGPLAGQSYKTPTGGARAVISYYKPTVSPNRNGWSFWQLDDGSNKILNTIR